MPVIGTAGQRCCPASMGFFEAIFSDQCQSTLTCNPTTTGIYDPSLPYAEQVNKADPNASFLSNLFSNEVNMSAVDAANQVVGLNIPQWAWVLGLGVVGLVALKGVGR